MHHDGSTSVTAVLLTAGKGSFLTPFGSHTPVAMSPIGGRPLISMQINHLRRCGITRFVIVTGHRGELIEDYLRRTYRRNSHGRLEIQVVRQEVLDGPLRAVRVAQSLVGSGPQLIVLGDTLVLDPLSLDKDFILVHPVPDFSRWCLGKPNAEGCLERLFDKYTMPPPVAERLALVGVYFVADTARWQQCVEAVFAREGARPAEDHIYQISEALEHYNCIYPISMRRANRWYDCGNPDRYACSRRGLGASRCNNDIHVDDIGVVTKTSRNLEVLQAEIAWYASIPVAVQPLVPRVFRAASEPGNTFLQLEYVPTPTLAEYFLFADVSPEGWEYALPKILDLWHHYFYEQYSSGDQTRTSSYTRDSAFHMYWEKSERRLADPKLEPILKIPVDAFNGHPLPTWPEIKWKVRRCVEDLAARRHWSLLHGDLHFGNILFDFGSGLLKVIDPRGEFGPSGALGCFGDAHYDLAKFVHSFHGGYAHLAADMFELLREGDTYTLILHGGANREHMLQVFVDWFSRQPFGINIHELFLLEGLLFISMLPFHEENTERQMAEYLVGLDLLDGALAALNGEIRKPQLAA